MATIVVTGGTFFKIYDPKTEKFVLCDRKNVKDILDSVTCQFTHKPQICIWDLKDSEEITDDDREKLLTTCLGIGNQVVVIHGTTTLHKTQQFFLNKFDLTCQKKIIITGAFIPASCKGSDAPFNLGFALGALASVTPGIYVAMNGRIYTKQVRKDVNRSLFETDI